jgi:uncharacterized protein DUF6249
MKTNWKKLIIIPLLLAVATAPVCGQSNSGAENGSSNAVAAAPTANVQTAATNADDGQQKKQKDDSDSTPVRIDRTGVHIGGKDPVDIDIGGVASTGMQNTKEPAPQFAPPSVGLSFGHVVVAVTAIVMTFVFLTVVIGCGVYFKFRRNRMLHETLRAMIEKGVPIPPELIVPPQRLRLKTFSDLRSGLVLLGWGLGMVILFGKVGFIMLFMGVAFLITWLIEKKQTPKDGQENK